LKSTGDAVFIIQFLSSFFFLNTGFFSFFSLVAVVAVVAVVVVVVSFFFSSSFICFVYCCRFIDCFVLY